MITERIKKYSVSIVWVIKSIPVLRFPTSYFVSTWEIPVLERCSTWSGLIKPIHQNTFMCAHWTECSVGSPALMIVVQNSMALHTWSQIPTKKIKDLKYLESGLLYTQFLGSSFYRCSNNRYSSGKLCLLYIPFWITNYKSEFSDLA